MKILEINKFNHIRGGADKHFTDLTRLLQENGNEAAIFAMEHPENLRSEWSKYFVSRVDYEDGNVLNNIKGMLRIFWSLKAKRRISKLLDEFKPDIAHIHNIYHQISPSILPEIKKRGIPVVMTVHDWKLICPNYLLNCEKPHCQKCMKRNYWHCLKNKCVKNSYFKSFICIVELYFHHWLNIYDKNIDLYIAPSQFVKNILMEADFPEQKIRVLPHFINRRGLTSIGQNGDYALYFGRVSKEKKVDELVEIFENLPIRFILAGKKDGDFEIPGYPNIKYVGFKNPAELENLIRNSKFVVSASRLPETFGLAALEAIRQNKPFLGYETGAFGEIVENDVNGYLAKGREEFRKKIAEYAAGNIPKFEFQPEKFSPKNYQKKIIDIFQGLC